VEGLKARGIVKDLEARFRMKDGQVRVGLMSASIMEINGERCILSVTRDISERKRMEQALREREEQLRLITDNMVDTISQVDAERKFIYASPSLERIFGYAPEDIIGRPAFEYVHPDDIPTVLETLAEAKQRGESSLLLKYRWRHADGRYLWVESATRLLSDEQGQPLGAIFGTRDITERQQAEDVLQSTTEMLLALIDASPVAIDIIDNAGNVKLWSPAAERLFGWSADEVVGQPLPFITHGRQYELQEQIKREVMGVSISGLETKRIRKDGSAVDVELWTVPLRDFRGKIIGSVGFLTDITERKKAEQQIQDLHSELLVAYDETLEGWSRALNLRDPNPDAHSKRVVDVTVSLARQVGIPDSELIHVRRGAILHDIGKMGIPDNILLKPEPLTEEEWRIMRLHPVFAHEMLSKIPFLRPSLDIPYAHHERWDGSGYPRKLKAVEIPLAARVFAVVDTFDALTSDRSYRHAWKREDALSHIHNQAGIQFDPQVVEVFLRTIS
ncbi:MAG: PAS domain S-box protein, partial [Anaerolineales bacterium]